MTGPTGCSIFLEPCRSRGWPGTGDLPWHRRGRMGHAVHPTELIIGDHAYVAARTDDDMAAR